MRAFYRDVIGLRPRSDRPGFVNFDFDGVRLTFSVHSDVVGPARDPLRIMLNLRTSDIDRAVARLRRAGVRMIRPPEPESWGGAIATFEDPDGNVLQYMQLSEYMPS
jgi:predicted enzyme related to lactoylglutathione lyase